MFERVGNDITRDGICNEEPMGERFVCFLSELGQEQKRAAGYGT
jgi:hypothetical protein